MPSPPTHLQKVKLSQYNQAKIEVPGLVDGTECFAAQPYGSKFETTKVMVERKIRLSPWRDETIAQNTPPNKSYELNTKKKKIIRC